MNPTRSILLLSSLCLGHFTLQAQETFAWSEPHAAVLANGELEYAPKPFTYVAGDSVRYIDFASGDDTADGTRAAPWKHHPWDPQAQALSAAAAQQIHTYIFKSGVTYRGHFEIPATPIGTPENPVRLTRDPSWGDGPAVLSGSEIVTQWSQGSTHPRIPNPQSVWTAEVDFLPRNLWLTNGAAPVERLKLARWPNWTESNPNDLMSEWPTWDQPEWWKGKNVTKIGNTTKHIGIAQSLPQPLDDLVGGTVWSEWGIVMGSPYPAHIEGTAQITQGNRTYEGIAFRGPWTYNALEKIITGNRYYLENLPQLLDEPGEFWVEQLGKSRARIHLRLTDGLDPNKLTVEAARHYKIFNGSNVGSIHWSGLTFRHGNVDWDYDHPSWGRPNLKIAAIYINGSADELVIANNNFEHLPMPLRISVGGPSAKIEHVVIQDNVMTDTDQGAANVSNFDDGKTGLMGQLGQVEFLRNKLENIGMRIVSGEHGHAVDIGYPETSLLAGNFLHRIAGWGLAVWGGKPSGGNMAATEPTLSRHLIHHNRVEDVLLKSNDWGGIETWQGGSHYVFNNIVINAVGYKNWIFAQNNKERASSFGHAYYMDGSFKNYLFNNIGLGLNNDVSTKGVNLTAIQNIISFENWYFNNSFHRFVAATRQQAPDAGRFRYLGNVFSDISETLYRHAEPKEGIPDPNASHFTQGGAFDYPTIAYGANYVHQLDGTVGTFEETGTTYTDPAQFDTSLARLKVQSANSVNLLDSPPFRDPDAMDWRPSPALAAKDGITAFVPWGLGRTVGEWNFTRNNANPNEVIDEHWFMTADYTQRQNYKDTPRYPLIGSDLSAASYVASPLENWTAGSLQLNGTNQYLKIAASTLPAAPPASDQAPSTSTAETMTDTKTPFGTVRHPTQVKPGTSYQVTVDLDKAYPGQQLGMHIHWNKSGGWGGFSSVTRPKKLSETRYEIEVKIEPHAEAVSYTLLPFLSPNGNWNEKTANASVAVSILPDKPSPAPTTPTGPWSPNILATNFMLEAIVQTQDNDGIIASKMANGVGYELGFADGALVFKVATDQGSTAKVGISKDRLNRSNWQHILAELDRENGKLSLYLNGNQVIATIDLPADFKGSLGNSGDFLVGGGPGKDYLAGSLDFLRLSASTLKASRTTAAELYAWTTNGPQYRDFAGQSRRNQNTPGALVE